MQCNWIILKPPLTPWSVENVSSTKPVPGAKEAGDHCSKVLKWGTWDVWGRVIMPFLPSGVNASSIFSLVPRGSLGQPSKWLFPLFFQTSLLKDHLPLDTERARNSLAQKQTLRVDLELLIRELERQRGECSGKVTPGFPSWLPLAAGKLFKYPGASVFSSLKWDDYNYYRVVLTTELGQVYNHTELDTEKLPSKWMSFFYYCFTEHRTAVPHWVLLKKKKKTILFLGCIIWHVGS